MMSHQLKNWMYQAGVLEPHCDMDAMDWAADEIASLRKQLSESESKLADARGEGGIQQREALHAALVLIRDIEFYKSRTDFRECNIDEVELMVKLALDSFSQPPSDEFPGERLGPAPMDLQAHTDEPSKPKCGTCELDNWPCQNLMGGLDTAIYENVDGLCTHPECHPRNRDTETPCPDCQPDEKGGK